MINRTHENEDTGKSYEMINH